MAKMRYEGKTKLWTGQNENKETFSSSSFKEVYLWCLGFGCDQAAELRYEMSRNKAKNLTNK